LRDHNRTSGWRLTDVSDLQTLVAAERAFIIDASHQEAEMSSMILAMTLWACGGGEGDDAVDTDAGETPIEDVFAGAPLTEPSDGDCPKLDSPGTRTFSSGGDTREVIVRFPKDKPAKMPVMFFWHGLGDSAANVDSYLDMKGFAEAYGAVVVIPQSTDPSMFTWNYTSGSADVTFYDDMRTCLHEALDVDLNRFSTTGFSFGGLFTTYLAMVRADTLSAAAPLSGGVDPGIGLSYQTPAEPLPVLVMWGGSSDTYGAGMTAVDFEETSLDFADALQADGSTVALCDHGGGHTLPFDLEDALAPWLLDHRYGEPSPFTGGLDGFPSYCSLAD